MNMSMIETFLTTVVAAGAAMLALEMHIADGSVLKLIRQWLKACAKKSNGVMKSPKGRGMPQDGVISLLLSNIYLHWFETIASLTAKAMGQAMSIVRYADDFVLLAKRWKDGFLRNVEGILEERMARFLNRKSQRYYRLEFADTYYGEMTHYGLHRLAWEDMRRARI